MNTCVVNGFEVALSKLEVKSGEVVLVKYPKCLSAKARQGVRDEVEAGLATLDLLELPGVFIAEEGLDVRILQVRPGDTVILRHPRSLSGGAFENLQRGTEAELAEHGLSDVPVLVCEEGMDAQVLQVKPGDTLVIQHPRPLSRPHKENLAASITASLAEHGISGVAVVVLDESASAEVAPPNLTVTPAPDFAGTDEANQLGQEHPLATLAKDARRALAAGEAEDWRGVLARLRGRERREAR